MIRWPLRSARAISRLFQPTQNIDVFVEDQGDERFYTLLFKKAAPEGVVISRVIGLGGCEAVKGAAASYADTRKALFLIDGDLPWVRGDEPPSLPRLYRLPCYCIENILISEKLVVEICSEEMMCENGEAKAALQMQKWMELVGHLKPLFARYAVLNLIDPAVTTVRDGLSKVIVAQGSHKLPQLCMQKVADKVAHVESLIESLIGADDSHKLIGAVERRVASLAEGLRCVSGKDYLLPLLHFHLMIVSKSRITCAQFRYRLASKADAADLHLLQSALAVAA